MRLLITSSFERTAMKLHKQQKTCFHAAVRTIAVNPELIDDLADSKSISLNQYSTTYYVRK
jgi:hypothetical protein